MAAPGYDLARWLVQRGVAAVYVVAFASVLHEWRPLLGSDGLTPVARWVARVPWRRAPSLFQWRHGDRLVRRLAWLGLALALVQLLGLPAVAPGWLVVAVWLLLWVLYLSYVNVGQVWYGFGWESLLCEAGFLVAWLGAEDVAPPWVALLLLRWLVVRVELGAGLIKLRGDPAWRDLTATAYHHETQPMPGPLSRWFHLLPSWAHRTEVAANHLVQVVLPLGLLLPQPVAGAAAVAVVATQLWLVASGNFAWLNWLTVVLATAALPDAWFAGLLPWLADDAAGPGPWPWWVAVLAVGAVVVWRSWWPVRNLASAQQRMNTSHDPLRLVNSYGAFGSVTRTRYELLVEGTDGDPDDPAATWHAYGFRGKPTDPRRRAPQVAPFHLRLDWLLWFAAMRPYPDGVPWVGVLVQRLLAADPAVLRLLRHDPFGGTPPAAVRVRRARYRFATRAEHRARGVTWVVEDARAWLAPRRGPA